MARKINLNDLSVCPDCGYKQSQKKHEYSVCENPDGCESEVVYYRGKLMWDNINWS